MISPSDNVVSLLNELRQDTDSSGARSALTCELCGPYSGFQAARPVEAKSDHESADLAPNSTFQSLSDENDVVDLAIEVLEALNVLNNPSASMRLIGHIAESAGYRRAHENTPNNTAELMIMAARAIKLAEHFREDNERGESRPHSID